MRLIKSFGAAIFIVGCSCMNVSTLCPSKRDTRISKRQRDSASMPAPKRRKLEKSKIVSSLERDSSSLERDSEEWRRHFSSAKKVFEVASRPAPTKVEPKYFDDLTYGDLPDADRDVLEEAMKSLVDEDDPSVARKDVAEDIEANHLVQCPNGDWLVRFVDNKDHGFPEHCGVDGKYRFRWKYAKSKRFIAFTHALHAKVFLHTGLFHVFVRKHQTIRQAYLSRPTKRTNRKKVFAKCRRKQSADAASKDSQERDAGFVNPDIEEPKKEQPWWASIVKRCRVPGCEARYVTAGRRRRRHDVPRRHSTYGMLIHGSPDHACNCRYNGMNLHGRFDPDHPAQPNVF